MRKIWTIEDIENLGTVTDLVTAGEILGIGRTTSHKLARAQKFPVRVLRHGRKYVVPVLAILAKLQSDRTGETNGCARQEQS